MSPAKHDAALLSAFASKAAALTPEAWDRIGMRCALLDTSTVGALLGRVDLFAGSMAPDSNPYDQPFVSSTMATIGRVFGMLHEVTDRLPRPDAETLERVIQQQQDPEKARQAPGFDALLRIESLAQRQVNHPGTAAALRAVSLALLARPTSPPATFDAIYKPFEPEIPFSSLSPGEHIA